MKYLILIGDGMSGEPLDELNGMTTLEKAKTNTIDTLLSEGLTGRVQNVPQGMKPGSDVATLSIFGYDPQKTYTGRGALEAAAMGIDLAENDLCFRCNVVYLEKGIMKDFTADHISKEKAAKVIEFANRQKDLPMLPEFFNGVSYRNLAVFRDDFFRDVATTPPHDITDQSYQQYLPQGKNSALLNVLIDNLSKRIQQEFSDPRLGIWLWGGGGPPGLKPISEQYQLHGTIITAVDLLKGIGKYAGFSTPDIPGATGFIDTDYQAKVNYALNELKIKDIAVVHIEAPDECGHMGNIDYKIQAIEDFDQKVVKPILEELEKRKQDFRALILPDHPTPIAKKTHTDDPVPFVLFDSRTMKRISVENLTYCEKLVADKEVLTGIRLLPILLEKENA